MIDSFKPTVIVLALLISSAAAPASATNLVVNGGFETFDFTGWIHYGDLSASGVTTSPAFVASGLHGVFAGPRDGYGYLDQVIPTLPNHNYLINFQWGARTVVGSPPNNYFSANFNGQQLFQRIDEPASSGFTYASLLGVSTGTTTVLGFIFANPLSNWALDDVAVTDLGEIIGPPQVGGVPEPASWAMLITGFGLIGAMLRRRRAAPVAA